jgi:hypothetical protein
MTQDFTDDSYDPDHVANTDLDNMENNFITLKSLFSGAASPPNPVAGMPWFDTSKKVKKYRNAANNAWLGVMHADGNQKIPVYRDDYMDGWLIDTGVTDCVIALKGGSQAYDVAAAQVAGSWNQPNHTLSSGEVPSHNHGAAGSHGHNFSPYSPRYGTGGDAGGYGINFSGVMTTSAYMSISSVGNHSHGSFGGSGSHNHGSTARVRAAIVTLQYLDL